MFAIWKHLMTAQMEAELGDVQKQCLQQAAGAFKAAPVKARAEAKKKPLARSVEDDIDATAMAMLGMS